MNEMGLLGQHLGLKVKGGGNPGLADRQGFTIPGVSGLNDLENPVVLSRQAKLGKFVQRLVFRNREAAFGVYPAFGPGLA